MLYISIDHDKNEELGRLFQLFAFSQVHMIIISYNRHLQFNLVKRLILFLSFHTAFLSSYIAMWLVINCVKYVIKRFFSDSYFLSLYWKIRVRENPYSAMIYTVTANKKDVSNLNHSFPMHLKGCIGNEWVKWLRRVKYWLYCIQTIWKVTVFGVILVRIFPHFRLNTVVSLFLSVFSPNAGKCGPE